jgi:uridine phosphorylase
MTLQQDRHRFEQAYVARSEHERARIPDWGSDVVLVASSPEYETNIRGLFDQVGAFEQAEIWGSPPRVRLASIAGLYRDTRITVLHTGVTPGAFGASYMDLGLEWLRNTTARTIVVIGELSSLQPHVRVGDLVVSLSAIRADDSHMSYADPDLPAAADPVVSQALHAAAMASAGSRAVHSGVCWSCGAGAGIYDPALGVEASRLNRLGVLGSAVEAATAYLLGASIGLRVGSLWLAADSIFEPITWRRPSPRLGWDDGWSVLAQAALDALAALRAAPGASV